MAEFDPFNKLGSNPDEHAQKHARHQSTVRSNSIEESVIKAILKNFDLPEAAMLVRDQHSQEYGKARVSIQGFKKVFSDFPFNLGVRRVLNLDRIGLADIFDKNKFPKTQLYNIFTSMEFETMSSPESEELFCLVFGPVSQLKGRQMVAYRPPQRWPRENLTRLQAFIKAPSLSIPNVVYIESFTDWLANLKNKWLPNLN